MGNGYKPNFATYASFRAGECFEDESLNNAWRMRFKKDGDDYDILIPKSLHYKFLYDEDIGGNPNQVANITTFNYDLDEKIVEKLLNTRYRIIIRKLDTNEIHYKDNLLFSNVMEYMEEYTNSFFFVWSIKFMSAIDFWQKLTYFFTENYPSIFRFYKYPNSNELIEIVRQSKDEKEKL